MIPRRANGLTARGGEFKNILHSHIHERVDLSHRECAGSLIKSLNPIALFDLINSHELKVFFLNPLAVLVAFAAGAPAERLRIPRPALPPKPERAARRRR